MGCCGDPITAENATANRPTYVQSTITNQQPSPQPGLEKLLFQQPTIPSPPPIHSQSGTAQLPPWGVTPFNPYPSPPSPPAPQSTFNGSNGLLNEPLLRPNSAHQSTYGTSPSMSMAHLSLGQRMASPPLPRASSPPPDEGKMSISIDFGESLLCITLGKTDLGKSRYNIFWRRESF
jgi:hypothetical protein